MTLLPGQLESCSLVTFGYDPISPRTAPDALNERLLDHALDLLRDLTASRKDRGASSRPILFVAHGYGGLVCKQAVLLSRNNVNRQLRDVFDNVRGFFFIGTPHRGEWLAYWKAVSSYEFPADRGRSIFEVLRTNETLLESTQTEFLSLLREPGIRGRIAVSCWFELHTAVPRAFCSLVVSANQEMRAPVFSMIDEVGGFGDLQRWIERRRKEIRARAIEGAGVSSPPAAALDAVSTGGVSNPGDLPTGREYDSSEITPQSPPS